MTKRKTKSVVITPPRGAQARGRRTKGASGSSASSAARSKKKGRRAAQPMWSVSDLDFDVDGRLVILNKKLAREIERRARADDGITVITGRHPPPPPSPPVDEMCGCFDMRFRLESQEQIELRTAPPLEHGADAFRGSGGGVIR